MTLRGVILPNPVFSGWDRLTPAGTYGGLKTQYPELTGLMRPEAVAILTGKQARAIPMPR